MMNTVTVMELKNERFNSWEWNMSTQELYGLVYVADDDEGNLVMMAQTEVNGTICDIEIIGISDDFGTITVSTCTAFDWGFRICLSHENVREAYLTMCLLLSGKF